MTTPAVFAGIRAFALAILLFIFFAFALSAEAAVVTWDGGGGADTNWGTCANWSGNTCPTSADVATFDATSTNNSVVATTLTGSTAPAGIDINSGYTGTLSVNSGVSVTVGSTGYDQAAGTFTGSDGAMTVNGSFVLSAGTFTAPSGTLTFSAGNFTHTAGGTFTHNSGTVAFTGGSGRTWDVATSEEFYNFTLNSTFNGAGLIVATGDTLNVNGTFTMTDGAFSTGTIAAKGAVSIEAGAGYSALTTGTLLINGSGAQTITVAPSNASNEVADQFTLNNASATVNGTGATGTLRFDKITVQAGTMALTTYALNAAEAVTVSGGTLSLTSAATATFESTFTLSSGAFTGGSATVDHGDTVTISGGTYTASSGTTSFSAGNYTHTAGGTFTHNSGTVAFTGGSGRTWDVATSEEFYNFTLNSTFNGAGLIVATGDTLNVNGTFTMTDGAFSTGTIAAKGAVSIEAGAGYSALTTGTLLINGSSSQNITVAPSNASNEVADQFTLNNASATVNGTGATGTLRFDKITVQAGTMALTTYSLLASEAVSIEGGTLSFTNTGTATFDSTFAISSGAFTAGSSTIDHNSSVTISGGTYTASSGSTTMETSFTHTAGGTFTHNSGTVTFDGASGTIDVATTETFGSLAVNRSSQNATIGTGDTLVVTGTLSLTDGKFNAGALEAQGDVTIATTYDTTGTTTLTFTGSATQTLTTNDTAVYDADVFVNKSGGQVNMVGTWTLNATNQDLTIQEGTFDLNGYALSVTGLGTEKIVVETGGNLQLQGGETITSDGASYPQLDSGSTVTYDGTSGPYTMKDYTYHHLTINGGASSVFTQAANESYGGNVTITQGILSQGGFTTTVTGTFSNSGTLRRLQVETFTGTMDVDSGTVEYVGDGDAQETVTITDFGGVSTDYYNLKINDTNVTKDIFALGAGLTAAGTLQVTSAEFTQSTNAITAGALTVDGGTFTGGSAAVTVSGALTLSSGTLTATTNTTTVSGAWTHTAGGTFTHNSGTVAFTGSAATVDVATSETFSALTINKTDGQTQTIASGDTLTATGVLTLSNGAWGTGGLVAQGNIVVGSGWDAAGSSTLTISGTGTQTLDLSAGAGLLDNPIIINKSGGSFTFASAVTLDATGADWTLTDGTVSTGNYTLTTSTGSDIAVNGGTLSAGSSTMTLGGALTVAGGTYNGNTSSGTISGLFTISSGAYNGNTSTPTFSGGLTISGGTFTASSNTTTVSGAWTHTAGGTFTHNSGTVAFTGSSSTVDVSTTETFSGLTINKTNGQTLTVSSGDTLIATGTLTLTDGTWATGNVQAQGNVSVPSTWDPNGTGTLEFAGSAAQTFDLTGATAAFDNPVNINKSGDAVTLASAYTLDAATADLTVTLGTFSTGNYALTTSSGSDIVLNGGTFNAGSSTMTIAGLLTVSGGTYNGNSSSGTVSGAFAISSGTYNGNTSTPTFSGGVTISGGTLTASSGTTTVSGGWTHTAGGTFTHNSGTVAFTGNSATADVTSTETFSALTINKTDGQTLTVASGDTLIATGTLTLTDGTWGTGSVQAQGNVSVPSTWDAGGSGTLEFAGTGTQTFDLTGAVAAFDNPVNVNKSGGSLTLASAYTLDHANADFTVTLGTFSTGNYAMTTSSGSDIAVNGGTFNAGSSTMTIAGALTVAGGTYNANTSTPTYSGAFTLSSGAYNGSSNSDTFSGTLTISGGTFTASDATTTVSSTWTHTAGGTFTHNGGTVAFTGNSSSIDVATSETFSSLTINKSHGQTLTVTSGDTLIAVGTMTFTNGAVGTGTLQAQGGVSVGSGYDGGNAPLTFAGTSAQTFTLTGATDKYDGDIEVNKSSNTVSLGSDLVMNATGQDLTVTSGTFSTSATNYGLTVAGNVAANGGTTSLNGSTVDLNGNLTLGGGTLTMGSATITIAGNVTYTSGTMTPGTSSVTLDGTDQQISGATSWNNLTKSVSSAATLTLPASTTTTVSGTLTLAGAAGQLLSLRSSSAGTAATLSAATTSGFQYLDVKDSTVSSAQITCLTTTQGCVNSGNNTNWKFAQSGHVNVITDSSSSSFTAPLTLTLLSPTGGETLTGGALVNVLWSTTGPISYARIEFSDDGGETWETVDEVANLGVYTWTVPALGTTTGIVNVVGTDLALDLADDTSDVFTIVGSTAADEEETAEEPTTPEEAEEIEAIAELIADLPEEVAVHGLVKTRDLAAVYYVGADGLRHAFPNEAVYFTWFCDFDDVQIIGAEELASIALGSNITYRPGTRMVKFVTDPKVYAVDQGGILRWVTTEALARELYGADWNLVIDDISDVFYRNYTFGDPITDASDYNPDATEESVSYPSDNFTIPGYEPTGSSLTCE